MKKKFLVLALLPILSLTSCNGGGFGFDAFKNKIDEVSNSAEYPYYRVIGSLDFNNEIMDVDYTFDKNPGANTFVPFSRFNNGFYCEAAGDPGEDNDILIYAMASHSYWLRAPLRIHKDNFYALTEEGKENQTSANYLFEHIITSYIFTPGANPSGSHVYYELLADGGFAVGGNSVHTEFVLDNYPYYPDYDTHPELGEWDPDNPLPCYANTVNAKVNVRFEYNANGWLVKESLSSINYDVNVTSVSQVSLQAVYTYKFA